MVRQAVVVPMVDLKIQADGQTLARGGVLARRTKRVFQVGAAHVVLLAVALAASVGHAGGIRFEDVTAATGLAPFLKDWRLAHSASWGDLNGDGWPELYVGAFANVPRWTDGPLPNMLFINQAGRTFSIDGQKSLQFDQRHARSSQVLMADLDQDGDLDMMVACHNSRDGDVPTTLWENTGSGAFREATPTRGHWPNPMGYRNVTAVDLNGDGRLDIVACDGSYGGGRNGGRGLIALINKGGFTFEDGRERLGLPGEGMDGLGLAVGDVNDDGRFDFFVAHCNRLLVSGPDGRYHEVQPGAFAKPQGPGQENQTCGAAFGDVNGDGLLDLVTSEHGVAAQIRLYVNLGIRKGFPAFRQITREAGLEGPLPLKGITGLTVKSGNVAIVDLDNDGLKDLWLSVVRRDADGSLQPLVFRNAGSGSDGVPRFTRPPWDRFVSYYAAAPLADYDRDGRMDCFMAAWFAWEETPSILFRNVTPGGHWLKVRVKGGGDRNTMGIGAVVKAYAAGKAGDPKALIQRHDIAVGTGYASSEEALAHLGLGTHAVVDVEVRWGAETRVLKAQAADAWVTVDWTTEQNNN